MARGSRTGTGMRVLLALVVAGGSLDRYSSSRAVNPVTEQRQAIAPGC
ncbi:MAG: hypothetical protein ACKVWV_06915 [Planctomycetota bacterium]